MDPALETVCRHVADALRERGLMLATAESCTGGGIAHALTDLAGSSDWFDSGAVTYSNEAKQALLGVNENTLSAHGAVSEQTAAEMALGAIASGRAQLGCSVTGVAGPGGGSANKPVGTVCFGWATADGQTRTTTHHLYGDRAAVRSQSVRIALQGVIDLLDNDLA